MLSYRSSVLVYRVEEPCGRGPYQGNSWKWGNNNSMSSDKHPMPCSDGLEWRDYVADDAKFGFKNLSSLRMWFDKRTRQRMAKHGYRCTVYEVPSSAVTFGKKQLVFRRKRARKKQVLSIVELVPQGE